MNNYASDTHWHTIQPSKGMEFWCTPQQTDLENTVIPLQIYLEISRAGKLIETENRWDYWVGERRKENGVLLINGYKVSVGGDEKVLELDTVMFAQQSERH